jgi:hypothetical protein
MGTETIIMKLLADLSQMQQIVAALVVKMDTMWGIGIGLIVTVVGTFVVNLMQIRLIKQNNNCNGKWNGKERRKEKRK